VSHFESLEDIKRHLMAVLKGVSESYFQQCFQAMQRDIRMYV